MDFSSSSSSPSSQYKGSAFIANTSKPSWDTPIYESCPQFNPMEHSSRIIAEENNRLASSSSPSQSNYASTTEEGGDRPAGESLEREHMFDKVVTPSDVGKLNRLVIPKQHAEKYFPLDSNSSEKGLLLDFEDRSGKSWRFRYSYWNSSQSYVMTKGWSRFVKDKKLDAGDVVSFHRALTGDRFYIDWRRRPDAHPHHHHHHPPPYHTIQFQQGFPLHRQIHPSSPFLAGPPRPPPPITFHHSNQSGDRRQLMGIVANPNHHRGSVISYNTFRAPASSGYNADYNNNFGVLNPNFLHQGSVVYMRPQNQQMQMMEFAPRTSRELTQTSETEPMVFDSVPVVHGSHASTSKRLRLFGVNMECTAITNESQGEPSDSSSYPPVSLNPTLLASPNSSEELQLRLHGSGTSTSPIRATDFVDKGKSSMSLDFDL